MTKRERERAADLLRMAADVWINHDDGLLPLVEASRAIYGRARYRRVLPLIEAAAPEIAGMWNCMLSTMMAGDENLRAWGFLEAAARLEEEE